MNLGSNLFNARKKRGLSQEEVVLSRIFRKFILAIWLPES